MKTQSKLFKHSMIVVMVTVLLLLIPLIAMQFSQEVDWSVFDFIIAGIMLSGSGLTFVFATHKAINNVYRTAMGVAIGTALFMVWSNLAVGLIGNEDNPINLLFGGVLSVGLIGAAAVRLKAKGMSNVLFLVAVAQVLVAVIALLTGHGETFDAIYEIVMVNGFFIVWWVISSMLFRHAANDEMNLEKAQAK